MFHKRKYTNIGQSEESQMKHAVNTMLL